jgi:uncharacterized protein (DUF2147 family)
MFFTCLNRRIACCSLIFCSLPAFMAGARAATGVSSPVGLWRTVDDKTNKPRGIIRIYEENGAFFGRIESSFNPEELTARCEKCTGDRKNAPIIGLVVLRGVTRRGSEYVGGEILDPETGWTYRCRFTLSGEGEKLFVRGYLGVSLLGRTQTWTRVETEARVETIPTQKDNAR